uniref:Uncharacterized protein n=1 Tax=Ananas comosus var. bracteatus TaxID=296719 RepID=A0A6V7P8S5_ANACO|nr:unnamed protein product [Ananas comosus var. bracteatus]
MRVTLFRRKLRYLGKIYTILHYLLLPPLSSSSTFSAVVIVKRLSRRCPPSLPAPAHDDVENEIGILFSLHGPRLVNLLGACREPREVAPCGGIWVGVGISVGVGDASGVLRREASGRGGKDESCTISHSLLLLLLHFLPLSRPPSPSSSSTFFAVIIVKRPRAAAPFFAGACARATACLRRGTRKLLMWHDITFSTHPRRFPSKNTTDTADANADDDADPAMQRRLARLTAEAEEVDEAGAVEGGEDVNLILDLVARRRRRRRKAAARGALDSDGGGEGRVGRRRRTRK